MVNHKLRASIHPRNSETYSAYYSSTSPAPKNYSVREVASILGIHETTVRRYIDRHMIIGFKEGPRKWLRITREAVRDYLNQYTCEQWRRVNYLWWE